jgi:hypothetical protein
VETHPMIQTRIRMTDMQDGQWHLRQRLQNSIRAVRMGHATAFVLVIAVTLDRVLVLRM